MAFGKFYGVGVGPGNPELLTLAAYRVVQEVDLVCTPKAKAENESLALSIVQQAINRSINTLELIFPMSSDPTVLDNHWEAATQQIVAQLQAGRDVAFITIGDPMFYSTYGYVLRRLAKYPEIQIETIPGVTAFSATMSFLNVPLTEGNDRLAVLPAVYDPHLVLEMFRQFDTLVLMKVNKVYDQIVTVLDENNLLGHAVYVSRCGYPDQFYTRDLLSLVDKPKDYMSMIIMKKVGWEGLK